MDPVFDLIMRPPPSFFENVDTRAELNQRRDHVCIVCCGTGCLHDDECNRICASCGGTGLERERHIAPENEQSG